MPILLLLLALVTGLAGADSARLEPPPGLVLFGLNIDAHKEALGHFVERTGLSPCHWVVFSRYPFRPEDRVFLDEMGREAARLGTGLVLTLEPDGGLDTVDEPALADLVNRITDWERRNIPVFIRFGHEMNGSWYAWSQQPEAYIATFRRMAAAVHAATGAAMIWAPNDGGGYPFNGGPPYQRLEFRGRRGDGTFSPAGTTPSLAIFDRMDTDRNGRIDEYDDMYAPFYPGDDAVDWLGMTLYHWGLSYPWGENEIAEPRQFLDRLTGTYNGANGDQRMVQDFYGTYADGHLKPLMITETAAFFNTGYIGGPTELAIKQEWWEQMFSRTVLDDFPRIRAITWFNQRKLEVEAKNPDAAGGIVDWTVSEPGVREAFVAHLTTLAASGPPSFAQRGDLDRLPGQTLAIDHRALPTLLGTSGVIRTRIPVVIDDPARARELVLHADLISPTGVWRGGATIPVIGTGAIAVDIPIATRLPPGELVTWSVFLGEPGAEWTTARAWAQPVSARIDAAATVDPTREGQGESINTADLPTHIPVQGRLYLHLATWASTEREVLVDLLTDTYAWHGGSRLRVPAGRWEGDVVVDLAGTLPDQMALTWTVLLIPPGTTWQQATVRGTSVPVVVDTRMDSIPIPMETPIATSPNHSCGAGNTWLGWCALGWLTAGWLTRTPLKSAPVGTISGMTSVKRSDVPPSAPR